mmetsp:Transcript_3577/g.8544  ORF Transcript_3577/g.8544 Transcript_3577/m.8544 type:complete len:243 (-) Transcript_3577:1240-1968(-)
MGKKGKKEGKEKAFPTDWSVKPPPPKTFDKVTKTWVTSTNPWDENNKLLYEKALLGSHGKGGVEVKEEKAPASRPKRLVLDGSGAAGIDAEGLCVGPRRLRRTATERKTNAAARAVYKSDFGALVSTIYKGEGGGGQKDGLEGQGGRTPLWERKDREEENMFAARRMPKRTVADRIIMTGNPPQVGRGTRRPTTAFDGTVFHSLHAPFSTPRSSRNKNLVKGYHFLPTKKDAAFWSMTNTRN